MSEIELWNELGNIYYRSCEYDKALRACRKMIELDPGSGLPYCNLAAIRVCQGRYYEAIPLLTKGIELLNGAFKKGFLWKQLGDTYRKLDDFKNASVSYHKAIALEPDNPVFQECLAAVDRSLRYANSASLLNVRQEDNPPPRLDDFKDGPEKVSGNMSFTPGKACWIFEGRETHQTEEPASDPPGLHPVVLGRRLFSDALVHEESIDNPDPLEELKGPDQITNKAIVQPHSPTVQDQPTRNPDDGNLGIKPAEIVNTFNTRAHGLLRLGIMHWREGDYERANELLNLALAAAHKSQNQTMEALCHYTIAHVETDLGKNEDAIRSYQSAVNLDPERIFPWKKLGDLNCLLGRYEDARAAFREAIEHDPRDPSSWNCLADVYHKLGRNEDAIDAYQLGNTFEKQEDEADVLQEFERALNSDQGNPQMWNEAGDIYYDVGAYTEAIASYCKAIELDPDNTVTRACLVRAEESLDKTDAGIGSSNPQPDANILQADRSQGEFHPGEGSSLEVKQPDAPEMDSTWKKPAQNADLDLDKRSSLPDDSSDPKPQPTYWMVGNKKPHDNALQSSTRNFPAAIETAVSTIKPSSAFAAQTLPEDFPSGNPILHETIQGLASQLVQLPPRTTRPPRSEPQTNEPVERPTLNAGNQGMSQPALDLQKIEKDISAYRSITEINPDNDRAWDTLGNLYEAASLHKEAITAFEHAIAVEPQREAYHYHLAIALAYELHYDEAIQALQKVVELNPRYTLAHCALAGYYRRLGMETDAQEHVKIARPCMENENEYNQACFESISGETDRAIALLEIAFKKNQIQPSLIRSDPDLDFIRKDPRFEALLAKNGVI